MSWNALSQIVWAYRIACRMTFRIFNSELVAPTKNFIVRSGVWGFVLSLFVGSNCPAVAMQIDDASYTQGVLEDSLSRPLPPAVLDIEEGHFVHHAHLVQSIPTLGMPTSKPYESGILHKLAMTNELHAAPISIRRATDEVDCNSRTYGIGTEVYNYVGESLATYLAGKDASCVNSSSVLFAINNDTFRLWSDTNIRAIAEVISARSSTFTTSQQQGILSLLGAIRAASYVQFYSNGGIPKWSDLTTQMVGVATAKIANTESFLAKDGAAVADAVFMSANGSQSAGYFFDRIFEYANKAIAEGDSFKTQANLNALNNMFVMLFRHNANQVPNWVSQVQSAPSTKLESLKNLSTYMNFALSYDNGRYAYIAGNAVYEFTRFMQYAEHRDYVDAYIPVILTTYAKFSAPWLNVAINMNYYRPDDCAKFNLCKSALSGDLKAKAFPNTFSFDDGNVVLYTAIPKAKAQQLYHAMKQVEAQYKRITQHSTPLNGDPNQVLKMYVYGSRSDYVAFHTFLFNLDTNNGGIYIEGDGTFYTYERTTADSNYTLEELLRHEYVHYLSSRFTIPGMWGQAPYYDNERLTWFEEGIAEFFTGATQADGILFRKNKIEGIVNDGADRMTVDEIVRSKYGNFRFYDYATALSYYLYEKRPQDFAGLFNSLRNGDVNSFDRITENLSSGFQAEFSAYTDGLVSKYALLPGFREGLAFDPDTFSLFDVGGVAQQFSTQFTSASCSKVFNGLNQRVGCTGYVSGNVEASVNNAIKALLSTKINNFKTLVCDYTKNGDTSANVYCEVGIRDSTIPQKSNNAPVAVDAGSTVDVVSGQTACLRANASDADGDIVVGYWQQKTGIPVNLGIGQNDVKFGACIAPTPNVTVPEVTVFELVINDGKEEVRMEHKLTINPIVVTPLTVNVSTSALTVSEGNVVSLTASANLTGATFTWIQTGGATVTLNQNGATATFTAPKGTSTDTALIFKATGTLGTQVSDGFVTITLRASVNNGSSTGNTASGSGGSGGSIDLCFTVLLLVLLGRLFWVNRKFGGRWPVV